jgi:hypothetical protein
MIKGVEVGRRPAEVHGTETEQKPGKETKMTPRTLLRSILSGLVLALCLLGTSPATAQTQPTDTECFTGDFSATPWQVFNFCNGQEITLNEGSFSLCVQVSRDRAGGFHLLIRYIAHGLGTDTAGNHYVAIWAEDGSVYVAPSSSPGPSVDTTPITFNLIGQGSAPDVRCHFLFHLTIDAQGRIVSQSIDITPGCTCVGINP